MSLLVKICGLKTPETVDAALDAGADMLGFVFFGKSPRNLSPDAAASLGARVRGRAIKVALSVDADDSTLDAIIAALAPDLLQLHGKESPARAAGIVARTGLPVMKAIGVGSRADLATAHDYAPCCARLLFDAKPPKGAALPGGNGLPFDWRLVAGLDPGCPVMLSGGLHPGNVAEAIRLTRLSGVDVSSGVESAPGQKDPDRIRAFVAAARQTQGEGEWR